MTLTIGRQGYLGLAIESTPGTPEASPSVYLPFTENSLQEKHEALVDVSSRASRIKDHNAIIGKKWGEGSIKAYADATNIGYLLKLAFGNEVKTVINSDVNDHQFYLTASGNTPKTATLWNYRGSTPSVKQYSRAAVDTFEFEVTNEDIATVNCGVLAGYPTKVTAPTLTTTSGTVFTWKDTTVRFGDTPDAALTGTAIKMTNFKLTVSNNVELVYRAGSSEPSDSVMGEGECTGEYTLFLEDDTELDKYRDLSKKSMLVDLVGAGLPGATTERLRWDLKKIFIEDHSVETDLGGIWAITQTFRCLWNQDDPGFVVPTLRNGKTSVY